MTIRELGLILVVVTTGAIFLWWETGRDEALISATAIMLGIFAFAGALAVVAS